MSHGVNVVSQEEAWSEIVTEMRLRWYGHMQRMKENNEMSAIGDMVVPGKRPRGRPRGRWTDC